MSDTNDIVDRLRAVLHNDNSVELMNGEAADEITHLRAEVADLKSRLDTAWGDVGAMQGIVERLTAERDAANARLALSMEAHQITISGTVASLLHMITLTREAAGCKDGQNLIAVVRGLRAERDEARRKWCELASAFGVSIITAKGIAKERGWDCFEKEAKP